MITRSVSLISLLLLFFPAAAQKVSQVYKISALLERMEKEPGPLVLNFWATWCKPCVEELPAFDSLAAKNKNIKVLLVCLDFKEEIRKKVNPFLQKKKIRSECVLLDEVNGNDYIDKISPDWSGAIPATLIISKNGKAFFEKKMGLKQLSEALGSH